MVEPNLEQFLDNLKKINELTNRAIDDLSNFLHNNESDVLNKKKIVNDLSPIIHSLIEETHFLKDYSEKFTRFAEDVNYSEKDPENHLSIKQNVTTNSTLKHVVESDEKSISGLTEEFSYDKDGESSGPLNSETKSAKDNEVLNDIIAEGLPNEITAEEAPNDIIAEGLPNEVSAEGVPNEVTAEGVPNEITAAEVSNEIIAEACTHVKDSSEIVKEKEFKPMLKIVDFSKLVDPRNLEFMNEQEKREKFRDTSIIVLSSSDDEPLIKNKKNISEVKQKTNTQDTRQKSLKKPSSKVKDTHKLAENSSSISSEDIKLRGKPYVKLLRVSSEEMRKYYSSRLESRSPNSLEKNTCDESDDEPILNYVKQKNNAETQGISKLESDNTEKHSKKSGKNINKKSSQSKKAISDMKKKNRYQFSSDSSDDEVPLKNEKQNKHTDTDESNKIESCGNTDTCDGGKSESSEDKEKNPVSLEEKEQEYTLKNTNKMSESDSSSESESFGNFNKKKLEKTGSKEQHNNEKDSDKAFILSSTDSDDSDVDTFFRKNKFVKKGKKIESSSDEEKTKNVSGNAGSKEENSASDASEKEDLSNKRKRRRIKQIEDNSSESDEATTRKKLKRLISKDSLSEQTKKAAAEERERKQRILDKQRKYNQIYEGSEIASSKVEKLVLDVDEKTGKPLLEVDRKLVSKLKPHQASGIQFMWDACFESLERTKKSKGSGCILAHCMGLGKTLQVIALAATLLESEETQIKKVLIVTPLSTVLNWKAEFRNWLSGNESFEVYELVSIRSQTADRASCVKEWHEVGGVMIISYAMFRNLSNDKNKKISKKFRTIFVEALVDPGPDLVVCDEGHLLKNEKTGLSISMNKIKTRRRIVLTGTPLQNNLKEYYCMVQFVKPNLLGTYKEYLNRFVNPITNGQYTDSTQYDINIMRRRSHVLHKLLDGIVQRRDYSVLSPYLPPKYEYVLFLTLTDVQRKLYKHYMDHLAKKSNDNNNRTSYLFKDFQAFSRICIHPRVLLDKSNDDQQRDQSDDESLGSLKDFIVDGDESSTTPDSSNSGSDSDESTSTKKKKPTKRITRAQKSNHNIESESEEEVVEKEWWQQYCDGEELDNMTHSTKLMLLFEILKECEEIGDKVLLFSQSLYALNLIEYFLEKVDEATQNGDADKKTCGYTGSWTPGLDYFRLDGSTNCGLRTEWCDHFNNANNSRARLFLLSTRAGGLGINLVAANRVILFDVSWNPSSDVQSIYRIYRFGQLKPSYVYRFVTYGTMEMKIYERQVTKQAISKRVIDEQQIDRHYNQNDLAELYKFEEPDLEVRPTPLVPKDVLLGEMLQNHDDKIYKYHEHQSLLENKEDEILNEEERKAAWEEFENEKVERTKLAFIGKFSINTIQLAMKNIIQRDNPTWNNNQILSIIPQLIQQLNLQLSVGDQTMYNRIAAEVKLLQDEYTRKRQMQYYQYQLQLAAQNQTPQNMFQRQFQLAMANGFPVPGVSTNPNPVYNLNPNEVVELN